MKKMLAVIMTAVVATGMLAGCGSSSDEKASGKEAGGKVYYLNFKPEADEYWQELAEAYTDETGVPVTVLTAASGEYEKTLKSEMAKRQMLLRCSRLMDRLVCRGGRIIAMI